MSEAWENYYRENDIERIQNILLQSLDVFDELCRKLKIKYYLYGGTMLGAIKYGGFVPWDDDLDLCLYREDYELLIKEGPRLLNSEYELQHPTICKKSPYHYIKFRKNNTTLVERENAKLRINHGIYFDIYPIDNIPDDYMNYITQKIQYDRWIKAFQIRQNFRADKNGSIMKFLVKQTTRFVMHMFYVMLPSSFYVKKIDKISTRFNTVTTKRKGNLSYPLLMNYFDENSEMKTVEFAGKTQRLIKGYEVNVKNRYGDISMMPPENNRVGHKAYKLEF